MDAETQKALSLLTDQLLLLTRAVLWGPNELLYREVAALKLGRGHLARLQEWLEALDTRETDDNGLDPQAVASVMERLAELERRRGNRRLQAGP